MKPALAVSLRSLNVRRGDTWVLRDINWELQPGERWALLGDNGAGKTQLLKVLNGEVWPTREAARAFRMGREPLELRDAKQHLAYVGGERQDKYDRYGWNLSVRDVVATGLHRTDLLLASIGRNEAKSVGRVLRACGLQALANRGFSTLSYGERRLALLARALVQEPDWLLLDEFYNGLDARHRRRVDAVLGAARRRGQSWIATAHRAADLPQGTCLLMELREGRILALRRLKREDRERLQATARQPGRPTPLRRKTKEGSALILRLSHVDLYVEHRAVLRDVNWELRRGEHWSVSGANGSGKSSFLKLLLGDLSPAWGGRIERSAFPAGTPISEWKRRVGYVSPELQSLYSVQTDILQLVASGRHASIGLVDPPTAQDRRIARGWLKFFELSSLAKRRPRELSYGQLRRALIARAMAANPKILLLDEPLTGLDRRQRTVVKRLLQRLMRRRVTVIAAVHHPEDLPAGMTHALHLHNRHARVADSYFAT